MVKIFVGNLSEDTTAEQLRSLFSQYGTISECDVLKKYGFVHMDDKAEADEAIRRLHHHQLNGQTINVEMSRGKTKNSTKLHVGNISSSCTNQELRARFEEFGPVVECDIVKDYAFVHMERVEDAMEAINGLDNTAFQGIQDHHALLQNGLPAPQCTGCSCKCPCCLASKESAVPSQMTSSACSMCLQVMAKLSSLEKSVKEIRALLLAQRREGQDNPLDGLEVYLPRGRRLEAMEELVEFEKMLQVEEHKRRLHLIGCRSWDPELRTGVFLSLSAGADPV
ncbi:RNA-binding protein 4B-like isoform X3 [Conger conger]|uniref:RNA-binding protein 4B-like isoform X3 n=1 Tax=Conger conger TaxID=82655 RepID=UPI002A5A3399|nr:RNA-binding protein 4B-like isoform X3 [Conger conger]